MAKTAKREARRKAREQKQKEQAARDYAPRGGSKYDNKMKKKRRKTHA
jgi:hypothetical protein